MKKISKGYYTNRHACFLLQYHLVLVTKYRKPVLLKEIDLFIKNYAKKYFSSHDCVILELESDKDHIHILFEAPVNLELTKFINGFKTTSSRMARKRFQNILNMYFWKPHFWSRSYFIATVSENTTEIVKTYIKNQGR